MRLHWFTLGALAISTVLVAQSPPPGALPQGAASPAGAPQANDGPADEPGRAVARLGILNGDASVRRGDSTDWVAAALNAPLMSGDELSVTPGGRAEVQLDAAHFVRIAGDTDLRLADLENGHFQVQLSHGLVTWRVLRDSQSHAEIDTPLVAVHPGRESMVRVEVSADGSTRVTVRRGDAQVSTQKGTERVSENSTMEIRGSANDPEFQVTAAIRRDEWDSWSDQRDTYLARAQSPRYVTEDVTGIEDLDAYGNWAYDPAYGWVWAPTVASSWAPYRDGRWVWEDYYGWTWVDYAPWGWAPFHYGNWYNRVGFGWSWYPGPRVGHIWWRPAMVGFFGWGGDVGFGGGFGFGNIGWVPLAPFERFHPWYGRGGFGGRNTINVNIARNTNIFGTFRNARVANGVTAVTAGDFQRGNFRNNVAVDRGTLQQASLVRGAVPMTPTSQNLRFNDRVASVQTPRMNAGASNGRFFGGTAFNNGGANGGAGNGGAAQRTPFTQQQSAVRSAFGAQQGQVAGSARVAPQSQPQAAGPGWQRFEGASAPNAGARAGNQEGSTTPGFNRFNGTPNGGPQNAPRSMRQEGPAGNPGGQQVQPRQFQVAPSIVRQRPSAVPETRQQYVAPAPQARPQQAPAPGGGGNYRSAPAPRSAPAGGSRQSGGAHSGRR